VCALPVELAAALEMFDKEHHDLERDPADNDENLYALGSIGGHNVAIVCLPASQIGNNPAAVVATQLRATFKAIRFGLIVGIGGGVPSSWISADTQLQSSRTPVDTDSIVTKTTITSSSSRSGHVRPKSPVKSMVDLVLLDRKLERMHMTIKDCPDTIRQLMRDVRDIGREKGMLPVEIRPNIEERDDVEAEAWWWSTTPSRLSKDRLLVELEVMDEIFHETHKQQDEVAAEPA
jgi:hypothetical protein